jgi:hypothetical protein
VIVQTVAVVPTIVMGHLLLRNLRLPARANHLRGYLLPSRSAELCRWGGFMFDMLSRDYRVVAVCAAKPISIVQGRTGAIRNFGF